MISKFLKLYAAKNLRTPSIPLIVTTVLVAGILALAQPAYAQSTSGPCATGGPVPNAASNPGLVADCETLLSVRNALVGTATLNWSENTHIGQWDGVTLDGSPIRVTSLLIWNAELDGVIPAQLGSLSRLQELSLVGNELTGEIPGALGGLTRLESLWLSGNQLTGDIPSELGELAELSSLHLVGNQLSGEIPSELGDLRNLLHLDLSSNQLTGEIPAELGGAANLQNLDIDNNRLTGEIPQRLTGLTSLEAFRFHNNAGICAPIDDAFQTWLQSIPTAIGSSCAPTDSTDDRDVLAGLYNTLDGVNWYRNTDWLSQKRLREWQGVTNDAAGRVDRLYLSGNKLSGEIPRDLGQLAHAKILSMSANQLTGPIPVEMGGLSNLVWLFLRRNQLNGEIPPALGSLGSLEWLYLSSNQLTGGIPTELGGLSSLKRLLLSSNQLSGGIPAELGGLGNLEWLSLGSNQLTGTIPPSLGGLTSLTSLDLSDNQLTGEIPQQLENIPGLRLLRLSGNELTACIPEGLRDVEEHDLGELGLPFCDVVLSSLAIRPGGLIQAFDPYRADYTVAIGPSRVTVVPTNDHNASLAFFTVYDEGGVTVEKALRDADTALLGFQVDFGSNVPAIKIRVISEDGQGRYTYFIADLGVRYDVNEDGSIARDEVIEAIKDYFANQITRDEVVAVIKLYFSR